MRKQLRQFEDERRALVLDISELHQADTAKGEAIAHLETELAAAREALAAASTKAEVSPAASPAPELVEVVEKWMAKSAGKAEQPRWKFAAQLLAEIRAAMAGAGKHNE